MLVWVFIPMIANTRERDGNMVWVGCVVRATYLDSQMAQPPDPDNADAICWLHAVEIKHIEHRCAPAHQRRGILLCHSIGDFEKERLAPDGLVGETALVEIGITVERVVGADILLPHQTLLALAARVVDVTPSYAVALFEGLDGGAGGGYEADAFVAENHLCDMLDGVGGRIGREGGNGTRVRRKTNIRVLHVDIGAAEAGDGDCYMDLVTCERAKSGFGLDDVAGFGAFEGRERDFV